MSQVELNDGSLTHHFKTVDIGGVEFEIDKFQQIVNDELVKQVYCEVMMDILNERQQERNNNRSNK